MRSDPTSPQGRKIISLDGAEIIIETPSDLNELLEKAARESPQNTDSIPYYSILWPSAVALARFLDRNRTLIENKEIIELGCGLGLPSILCAKLGSAVTATDFHPDNREWLLHNADANAVSLCYRQLDWNTFIAAAPESPLAPAPLVIGSDLVYERMHIPALVCAINCLCAPGGSAVIADPGRDHLPLFTSAMEKRGWTHTLIPEDDTYILLFSRTSDQKLCGL